MTHISNLHYADPLVQSPSETNQWMVCQQLWYLTRKHGLSGLAVKEGRKLASLIHQLRGSKSFKPVKDKERHLAQLAYQAISVTSKEFGAPLYTELSLGRARLDEVFATRCSTDIIPTIIDYKYFDVVDDEQQASFIAERFKYDHQLMHYAWAYLQYVNRWYSTGREASIADIGVCVLTAKPKMLGYVKTWIVTKQHLMLWLSYVVDVWQQMAVAHQGRLTRNLKSCYGTVYGECNQYKRCWQPVVEERQNG